MYDFNEIRKLLQAYFIAGIDVVGGVKLASNSPIYVDANGYLTIDTESVNLDEAAILQLLDDYDYHDDTFNEAKYALLGGSASQNFATNNLTVSGTLSIAEVSQTNPYITVNSGAAEADSGLKVHIGSSTYSTLYRKASDDLWYIDSNKLALYSSLSTNQLLQWDGSKLTSSNTLAGTVTIDGLNITSTNKLVFNNDATNYYMQYLNTTYGIKANSKYGWSFYGNETLSVLFSDIGVLIPSHLKSYASISSLSAFGVAEFYNTYNNFDANQTVSYPVALFGRDGKSGNTYNSEMAICVSRYENISTNARTQIDFKLAHSTAGYPDITVMSLRSNGYIGIGTTTPTVDFHLQKSVNGSVFSLFKNEANNAAAYAAIAVGCYNHSLTITSAPNIYSSAAYAGKDTILSTADNGLQLSANYLRFQNTLGTDALTITGGNFLYAGNLQSSSFSSGWSGSGWKLNNTLADLELNTLTVRGTLSVYELLIQQIRAVAGMQIVSPGNGKVKTVSGSSGSETITIDDPTGVGACSFAQNDIVICQRVAINGSTLVKRIVRRVSSVTGTSVVFTKDGDMPTDTASVSIGDEFVTIGNTTNIARQGSVMISSSETYSPYVDVISGVTSWTVWLSASKTKARLGRKDGITDLNAGLDGTQVNDYGLYSQNVNLSGKIYATSGRIGLTAYWNFDTSGNLWSGDLAGAGIHLSSRYQYIDVGITTDYCVKMYYSSGNYGFDVVDDGSSVVHMGSGTNFIGPWNFNSSRFWTGTPQDSNNYTANASSITLSANALRMYNFRVDTTGNMYARGGGIGNLTMDGYGLYKGVRILTPNVVGKVYFGMSDYLNSIGVYLDNNNGTDGGCNVGGTKTVNLGQIHTKDNLTTLSSDYGLEIIKRTATSTYEHVLRIGGSEAFIGGFNFDDYKLYMDNISIETVKPGKSYNALIKTFTSDSGAYIKTNAAFIPSTSYCVVYGNSGDNRITLTGSNNNASFLIVRNNVNKVTIDPYSGYTFEKNDADSAMNFSIKNLPSSSSGLSSGRLYRDSNGFVKVVL